MEQRPARPAGGGFDFGAMSSGQKILLIGGVLLLIDLFLPWNSFCVPGLEQLGIPDQCASASGWSTIFGTLTGLFLIALLAWEALNAFGSNINLGNMNPAVVSAILAGAAALFAIIRAVANLEGASFGLWLGIVLALVLAYGAYARFQDSQVGGGMPGRSAAPPAP